MPHATSAADPTLRLPPADRGWRQTLWVVLGALMFAGFLAGALVYTAPVLVSDWRVRDAARPLANAEVVTGRCSTKLVLTVCDATLRARGPGGPVTREVTYAFTGLHLGDDSVRALADPGLVTTDLGLDRLWNRTITLALGVGLLLGLSVLPLAALVRNRRGRTCGASWMAWADDAPSPGPARASPDRRGGRHRRPQRVTGPASPVASSTRTRQPLPIETWDTSQATAPSGPTGTACPWVPGCPARAAARSAMAAASSGRRRVAGAGGDLGNRRFRSARVVLVYRGDAV